jgi:DNA-binding NtrC family response regulator
LEVMNALGEHDWPGNVRELQNCMDRMAAMSAGPALQMDDLPSPVHYSLMRGKLQLNSLAAFANGKVIVPLHELEKRAILEAIEYTHGDRTTAASLLGIGRTTLYRKMKEYNLEIESRARYDVQPGD